MMPLGVLHTWGFLATWHPGVAALKPSFLAIWHLGVAAQKPPTGGAGVSNRPAPTTYIYIYIYRDMSINISFVEK